MENNRKDNKIEEQTRSMLVDLYQTVKKGEFFMKKSSLWCVKVFQKQRNIWKISHGILQKVISFSSEKMKLL